jgi:hypothetical protein
MKQKVLFWRNRKMKSHAILSGLDSLSITGRAFDFDKFLILLFVCMIVVTTGTKWTIFEKLKIPGWIALLPIVNWFVLMRKIKSPYRWIFYMFVPYLNLFVWFLICQSVAKEFKRSDYFALGLTVLPFLFWPKLAFDESISL